MSRGYEPPLTETDAISVQLRLRRQAVRKGSTKIDRIGIVAGLDAAYDSGHAFGAIVCITYPGCRVLESAVADAPVTFPYIPGLFAFREYPVLADACRKLETTPDLVIAEGHGVAHPRRFGLASHIGLVLDIPSIGVAKSPLAGKAQEPGPERGSTSEIMEEKEVLGMAVRTMSGEKPVYVSRGYRAGLEQAVTIVLALTGNTRMPYPLVCADRLARRARAQWRGRMQDQGVMKR